MESSLCMRPCDGYFYMMPRLILTVIMWSLWPVLGPLARGSCLTLLLCSVLQETDFPSLSCPLVPGWVWALAGTGGEVRWGRERNQSILSVNLSLSLPSSCLQLTWDWQGNFHLVTPPQAPIVSSLSLPSQWMVELPALFICGITPLSAAWLTVPSPV